MVRTIEPRAPDPPGASQVELAEVASPARARADAMRRFQFGAIGILAVLVLIGLASIIEDRAKESDRTTVAEAVAPPTQATASAAADPLAQAGVVPEIAASPTATQTTTPTRSPAPAASEANGG